MIEQKNLKVYVYVCLVICTICLIAAIRYNSEQEKKEKEKQPIESSMEEIGEKIKIVGSYEKIVDSYEKRLRDRGVVIPEVVAEDKQFVDVPWVKDRVQLPNSQTIVSLDRLRQTIYIYNIFNTQEGKEPLDLTAEDVISLCSGTNSEKSYEYHALNRWYDYWHDAHYYLYYRTSRRKTDPNTLYKGFAMAAHNHYKDKYGKPFIDKGIHLYTAEETDALVKWTIENVDYEYLEKIKGKFDLHKDSYHYYGVEKYYFEFLWELGIINENGEPIKPPSKN